MANNGTRTYSDLIANLEGCTANVRFDETRDDFNVMQVSGDGKRRATYCRGGIGGGGGGVWRE